MITIAFMQYSSGKWSYSVHDYTRKQPISSGGYYDTSEEAFAVAKPLATAYTLQQERERLERCER